MGREAAAACEDREAGQLREGVHHQAERRHGTVLSVDQSQVSILTLDQSQVIVACDEQIKLVKFPILTQKLD